MKIAKFFLFVGLVFCEGALCAPASYAADIRMFVHHEVADYATWRKSYDAFDTTRKALGVTGQAVYQTIEPLAKLFGCREWRRPMGGHKGDVAP